MAVSSSTGISSSENFGKGSGRLKHILLGNNSRNLPLAIIAVIVLVGSFSVLVHNELTEEDTDTIRVYEKEYTWDEVFDDFETIAMDDREGVILSDLVNNTGLKDPEDQEYRIIAADGYVKTVTWDDMQNGIVMKSKETYFKELEKQFFVKDVVEIEVK